jgi:ribosome recycling factor
MSSILDFAKQKTSAAVDHLRAELKGMRTNRANPAMLDSVVVEVFETTMPLKSVATITTPESRQLLITPFDPKTAQAIAKSIEKNKTITFVPVVDGHTVRINVPPMDEAMRKEIVKACRKKGEEAKISVREVRHKGKDLVKKAKTDGELTEDGVKKVEKDLQDLVDKACKEIDEAVTQKEKEVMTV